MKIGILSYYVRIKPQLNGTNMVHNEDCPLLPDVENRIYLGEFTSNEEALLKAKLYFQEVSVCNFCSKHYLEVSNKLILKRLNKNCFTGPIDVADFIDLKNLSINN